MRNCRIMIIINFTLFNHIKNFTWQHSQTGWCTVLNLQLLKTGCSLVVECSFKVWCITGLIVLNGSIELFLVLVSSPQVVEQRLRYVSSCLWDDAYKRLLSAYWWQIGFRNHITLYSEFNCCWCLPFSASRHPVSWALLHAASVGNAGTCVELRPAAAAPSASPRGSSQTNCNQKTVLMISRNLLYKLLLTNILHIFITGWT